MKLVAIYH